MRFQIILIMVESGVDLPGQRMRPFGNTSINLLMCRTVGLATAGTNKIRIGICKEKQIKAENFREFALGVKLINLSNIKEW